MRIDGMGLPWSHALLFTYWCRQPCQVGGKRTGPRLARTNWKIHHYLWEASQGQEGHKKALHTESADTGCYFADIDLDAEESMID